MTTGPDPRFFETLSPVTLADAAGLTRATLAHTPNPEQLVHRVSALDQAGAGDAAFAQGARAGAPTGAAPTLLFVEAGSADAAAQSFPMTAIAVASSPRAAFARLASALHRSRFDDGQAANADRAAARIADTARISSTAIIFAGAEIGPDVVIGPFAIIGHGCRIGAGTMIGPHVSVTHADIGANCRIASGARIGEPGFGYAPDGGDIVPVPQLGRVQIADSVDVGANSTIDRGALGDTSIGEGTRIDNLVHIAHNCEVGRRVLIAAQVGLSGSVRIGDGVMMAGQVGVGDHLTVGPGASFLGRAAVMRDVPAGARWGGTPAQPARDWMREVAVLRRLVRKGTKE